MYSYHNPNGRYISVQSVGGSVTRRAAAKRGRWWITDRCNEHNQPRQYSAYGGVAHARRMGGSVVTSCSVHVVCCLPGTYLDCVFMRA